MRGGKEEKKRREEEEKRVQGWAVDGAMEELKKIKSYPAHLLLSHTHCWRRRSRRAATGIR
jgi:hypothetical protein